MPMYLYRRAKLGDDKLLATQGTSGCSRTATSERVGIRFDAPNEGFHVVGDRAAAMAMLVDLARNIAAVDDMLLDPPSAPVSYGPARHLRRAEAEQRVTNELALALAAQRPAA